MNRGEHSPDDSLTRLEGEPEEAFRQRQAVVRRMAGIGRKLIVLSGKGGVGKSTVALNLALALARHGRKVGLLDVDLHGPSIPEMLRLAGGIVVKGEKLLPVAYEGIVVMSMGLMLGGPEESLIWRGPMKMAAVRQFLGDVQWGSLDDLVIDCPPGTGDEPLAVVQMIGRGAGAVIVTTPQEVALADVRRSITFCRQAGLPILGVVENMSGFVCPRCHETTDVFKSGGGEKMAADMGVPFLGRVPLDPVLVHAADDREPVMTHYAESLIAQTFREIVDPLLDV